MWEALKGDQQKNKTDHIASPCFEMEKKDSLECNPKDVKTWGRSRKWKQKTKNKSTEISNNNKSKQAKLTG